MPSELAIATQSARKPCWASARSAASAVIAAILIVTLYRVILAFLDRTELSTDEAQYWFWAQEPAFGYFSKPPLIAWVIRLSTDFLGQTVAAVRLPAPIFHGATALVLFLFARRVLPVPVAALCALSYLTLPAVALGSALMTTDTPMLLFAALAMTAQVFLAEARADGTPATGIAMLFGLALGLGLLSKHAMVFWLIGAVAAAAASTRFRIRLQDGLLGAVVMLAVIGPHLFWLDQAGFITFKHVSHITHGNGLSVLRPLVFLAQQGIVMGPVLFIGMLLVVLGRPQDDFVRGLVALALVPLLIVLAQGIKGPVLANWAVLFLVPGSVLAALWLASHSRLLKLSMAFGLAITLSLPLIKVVGVELPGPNAKPLLSRYIGHEEVAAWALQTAMSAEVATLVVPSRDLIADLSWFSMGSRLVLRAMPPKGTPAHHWEMTAPFNLQEDPRPVALIWPEERPIDCAGAERIGQFTAPAGAYGGRKFIMLRLDSPGCLFARMPFND